VTELIYVLFSKFAIRDFRFSEIGITLRPSVILLRMLSMATTVTSKGQVTIPKQVRDALNVQPGCEVEFDVNKSGEVILRKVGARAGSRASKRDRFDKVRGTAQIKWRTEKLMELLRG
jgi:antitoxin PrlF